VILAPLIEAFTNSNTPLEHFNSLPRFYTFGPSLFVSIQVVLGDCFLVSDMKFILLKINGNLASYTACTRSATEESPLLLFQRQHFWQLLVSNYFSNKYVRLNGFISSVFNRRSQNVCNRIDRRSTREGAFLDNGDICVHSLDKSILYW
jgi:hypothetical protein